MDYTYKGFTISMEMELINIYHLEVIEEVNQHVQLTLQGICRQERFDQFVSQVDEKEKIIVRDSEKNLFFCGLITNIQLEEKKQVCYFKMEAVSFTYHMDLLKRKRVFQNLDMTYQEVLNTIAEKYPNASFIDKVTENKKIPHILIQYNETDWEFIRRLASHFHDGIYTNPSTDTIQISFGRPLHEKVHEINRQPEHIRLNLLKKQERDCFESYEKYEIGDTIINQGRTSYVHGVSLLTKKEEIRFKIQMLCNKEEKFPYVPNKTIANAREWAYITDIQRNELKLHFLMEDITGNNVPLFPFEAGENNEFGYYMSEKGNKVEVYFPDEEEKNGIVTCTMREGTGCPIPNPQMHIQYMKNENGNELSMDLQSVKFSTGGEHTVIHMTGDGILRLETDDSLKLSASGSIKMEEGLHRLQVSAGKGIQLKAGTTGNNSIELDESGNVECRCSGNVLYKKTGKGSSTKSKKEESSGADQVRDVALSLAGVEFVSQSITGKPDYSAAGKVMNQLIKTDSASVEINNYGNKQNPIKAGLFHNNDVLFHSFSYGENRNGNKK